MAGLLSRGVLIGDTRITVTLPGKPDEEFDGVQKVHEIHGNMAMGFAGNIDTGFKMVGDLRFVAHNSIPPNHLTNEPSRLILNWARRARYHWHQTLTPHERRGGCELLFVAARPTLVMGITPTVAYTLTCPDFTPTLIPVRTAGSIGSGANVDEYAEELEKISGEFGNLIRFDNEAWAHVGGPILPIVLTLADRIRKRSAPGISPHLVMCSVQWGSVLFSTNEGIGFTDNAREARMPPIARSWNEWQQFKNQRHLANALTVG